MGLSVVPTLVDGAGCVCSVVVELVLVRSVGAFVDGLVLVVVLVEILGFKCGKMSFGECVRDAAEKPC